MIAEGVIKEHEGPSECKSKPRILPQDNDIRVNLDYRNANKELLNTHCPIL